MNEINKLKERYEKIYGMMASFVEVADIVLSVQKNNGGWMKNDQLHKLTASELNALQRSKGEHSCFDNYATTQEMRFLARVYQKTKVEKYRTAIARPTISLINSRNCAMRSSAESGSAGGTCEDAAA